MIKITLPDGSVRECEKGTKIYDIASGISEGLANFNFIVGTAGTSKAFQIRNEDEYALGRDNALLDALDELTIMRLLGHDADKYFKL